MSPYSSYLLPAELLLSCSCHCSCKIENAYLRSCLGIRRAECKSWLECEFVVPVVCRVLVETSSDGVKAVDNIEVRIEYLHQSH
jgi:hypothetical protein